MNIGGILEISVGEIAEMINKVQNHSHKDTKALCINLEIINTSLQNWYDDIIDKFSHWVENDMKVDSSELGYIYKCARDSKRKTNAEKSIGYLGYVEGQSNKLRKVSKGRLDIDKITQARKSLEDFRDQTAHGKDEWMEAAYHKEPFSRERVMSWHDLLENDRKVINESLSSVRLALECQPISNEDLVKYGLKQ